MATQRRRPFDPVESLLKSYAASARVTEYLLERLDPEVWRAPVPGKRGKTIAQIVSHMHNCGLVYVARTSPSADVPPEMDRHRVTRAEAIKLLKRKRRVVLEVVGAKLQGDGRLTGFPHDAAHFLSYYMVHDGHHRGQITLMTRLLGHPIDTETMSGMWMWPKRARE
ncbi:MAG TPA: DinB family protein [Gemmatimonadales bacterium]|jgi:uncharacterized damage-inducible protein DinB